MARAGEGNRCPGVVSGVPSDDRANYGSEHGRRAGEPGRD